jgi:hypothetical protein
MGPVEEGETGWLRRPYHQRLMGTRALVWFVKSDPGGEAWTFLE